MIDKRIRFRQKKISKNFVETENRRLSSKVFYVNSFEKSKKNIFKNLISKLSPDYKKAYGGLGFFL